MVDVGDIVVSNGQEHNVVCCCNDGKGDIFICRPIGDGDLLILTAEQINELSYYTNSKASVPNVGDLAVKSNEGFNPRHVFVVSSREKVGEFSVRWLCSIDKSFIIKAEDMRKLSADELDVFEKYVMRHGVGLRVGYRLPMKPVALRTNGFTISAVVSFHNLVVY